MVACTIMAICKKTFLFAVISILLSLGNGRDTETKTGAAVSLHCNSFNADIEWLHSPVGRNDHDIVYQDGFMFNGYKERFSVSRKDNGECDLVIRNVKTSDAGKYTCVEKSKIILQSSAELIVFEQYPSNTSCAAKYICTPACDALELTCSMKSYGKIIPSMHWQESTKGILTSNSNNENGITVSSIHIDLQHSKSDTQFYTCRVKYPKHSSLTTRFSWSYLVSVPALKTPSSSDEKIHVQTNSKGFIVAIALMAVAIVAMVVGFVIYFIWSKRKTDELNLKMHKDSEGIKSHGIENENLLKPEDNDDNFSGFVPRMPCNKNKSIYGVGVLDNEIFLMTRDSCIIEVFDLETAEFKRAWMVEGLINPNDMATCPIKSLIFICDWNKTGRRSEIICCDRVGKLNYRWTPQNERCRISVTKQTNVIVAENYFNTITEYTQDGTYVDKLRTGKIHLENAVKLENGNFVASFGDVQDAIREICIFDRRGTTLCTINQDSYRKQFGVQLSVPKSLVVDNEGTIYVSDLYNSRIIMLTSELQFKGKIGDEEDEEDLRGPLRICIHESQNKRLLMVADSVKKDGVWADGRILALKLAQA